MFSTRGAEAPGILEAETATKLPERRVIWQRVSTVELKHNLSNMMYRSVRLACRSGRKGRHPNSRRRHRFTNRATQTAEDRNSLLARGVLPYDDQGIAIPFA